MEILTTLISFLHQFIDLILHLDQTLSLWAQWMGPWLYVVMFLIVFAETGLVVTPFLPGDSLLFALGALAALEESGVKIEVMIPLLMVAALMGDNVNYFVGRWIGKKAFSKEKSKIFNPKYLEKAHNFYELHGPKAIILGRFMPIVRTFVPFVAGVGSMTYRRYMVFCVIGAVIWINLFMFAGYIFGNLPQVKTNFHIVIIAVIGLSLMPMVIELVKARRQANKVSPKPISSNF